MASRRAEAGERVRVVPMSGCTHHRRRAKAAGRVRSRPITLTSISTACSTRSAPGKLKELIIILKADVRGSAEALKEQSSGSARRSQGQGDPLRDRVRQRLDVMLAEASNGSSSPSTPRSTLRRRSGRMRPASRSALHIIYQALEDLEKALVACTSRRSTVRRWMPVRRSSSQQARQHAGASPGWNTAPRLERPRPAQGAEVAKTLARAQRSRRRRGLRRYECGFPDGFEILKAT